MTKYLSLLLIALILDRGFSRPAVDDLDKFDGVFGIAASPAGEVSRGGDYGSKVGAGDDGVRVLIENDKEPIDGIGIDGDRLSSATVEGDQVLHNSGMHESNPEYIQIAATDKQVVQDDYITAEEDSSENSIDIGFEQAFDDDGIKEYDQTIRNLDHVSQVNKNDLEIYESNIDPNLDFLSQPSRTEVNSNNYHHTNEELDVGNVQIIEHGGVTNKGATGDLIESIDNKNVSSEVSHDYPSDNDKEIKSYIGFEDDHKQDARYQKENQDESGDENVLQIEKIISPEDFVEDRNGDHQKVIHEYHKSNEGDGHQKEDYFKAIVDKERLDLYRGNIDDQGTSSYKAINGAYKEKEISDEEPVGGQGNATDEHQNASGYMYIHNEPQTGDGYRHSDGADQKLNIGDDAEGGDGIGSLQDPSNMKNVLEVHKYANAHRGITHQQEGDVKIIGDKKDIDRSEDGNQGAYDFKKVHTEPKDNDHYEQLDDANLEGVDAVSNDQEANEYKNIHSGHRDGNRFKHISDDVQQKGDVEAVGGERNVVRYEEAINDHQERDDYKKNRDGYGSADIYRHLGQNHTKGDSVETIDDQQDKGDSKNDHAPHEDRVIGIDHQGNGGITIVDIEIEIDGYDHPYKDNHDELQDAHSSKIAGQKGSIKAINDNEDGMNDGYKYNDNVKKTGEVDPDKGSFKGVNDIQDERKDRDNSQMLGQNHQAKGESINEYKADYKVDIDGNQAIDTTISYHHEWNGSFKHIEANSYDKDFSNDHQGEEVLKESDYKKQDESFRPVVGERVKELLGDDQGMDSARNVGYGENSFKASFDHFGNAINNHQAKDDYQDTPNHQGKTIEAHPEKNNLKSIDVAEDNSGNAFSNHEDISGYKNAHGPNRLAVVATFEANEAKVQGSGISKDTESDHKDQAASKYVGGKEEIRNIADVHPNENSYKDTDVDKIINISLETIQENEDDNNGFGVKNDRDNIKNIDLGGTYLRTSEAGKHEVNFKDAEDLTRYKVSADLENINNNSNVSDKQHLRNTTEGIPEENRLQNLSDNQYNNSYRQVSDDQQEEEGFIAVKEKNHDKSAYKKSDEGEENITQNVDNYRKSDDERQEESGSDAIKSDHDAEDSYRDLGSGHTDSGDDQDTDHAGDNNKYDDQQKQGDFRASETDHHGVGSYNNQLFGKVVVVTQKILDHRDQDIGIDGDQQDKTYKDLEGEDDGQKDKVAYNNFDAIRQGNLKDLSDGANSADADEEKGNYQQDMGTKKEINDVFSEAEPRIALNKILGDHSILENQDVSSVVADGDGANKGDNDGYVLNVENEQDHDGGAYEPLIETSTPGSSKEYHAPSDVNTKQSQLYAELEENGSNIVEVEENHNNIQHISPLSNEASKIHHNYGTITTATGDSGLHKLEELKDIDDGTVLRKKRDSNKGTGHDDEADENVEEPQKQFRRYLTTPSYDFENGIYLPTLNPIEVFANTHRYAHHRHHMKVAEDEARRNRTITNVLDLLEKYKKNHNGHATPLPHLNYIYQNPQGRLVYENVGVTPTPMPHYNYQYAHSPTPSYNHHTPNGHHVSSRPRLNYHHRAHTPSLSHGLNEQKRSTPDCDKNRPTQAPPPMYRPSQIPYLNYEYDSKPETHLRMFTRDVDHTTTSPVNEEILKIIDKYFHATKSHEAVTPPPARFSKDDDYDALLESDLSNEYVIYPMLTDSGEKQFVPKRVLFNEEADKEIPLKSHGADNKHERKHHHKHHHHHHHKSATATMKHHQTTERNVAGVERNNIPKEGVIFAKANDDLRWRKQQKGERISFRMADDTSVEDNIAASGKNKAPGRERIATRIENTGDDLGKKQVISENGNNKEVNNVQTPNTDNNNVLVASNSGNKQLGEGEIRNTNGDSVNKPNNLPNRENRYSGIMLADRGNGENPTVVMSDNSNNRIIQSNYQNRYGPSRMPMGVTAGFGRNRFSPGMNRNFYPSRFTEGTSNLRAINVGERNTKIVQQGVGPNKVGHMIENVQVLSSSIDEDKDGLSMRKDEAIAKQNQTIDAINNNEKLTEQKESMKLQVETGNNTLLDSNKVVKVEEVLKVEGVNPNGNIQNTSQTNGAVEGGMSQADQSGNVKPSGLVSLNGAGNGKELLPRPQFENSTANTQQNQTGTIQNLQNSPQNQNVNIQNPQVNGNGNVQPDIVAPSGANHPNETNKTQILGNGKSTEHASDQIVNAGNKEQEQIIQSATKSPDSSILDQKNIINSIPDRIGPRIGQSQQYLDTPVTSIGNRKQNSNQRAFANQQGNNNIPKEINALRNNYPSATPNPDFKYQPYQMNKSPVKDNPNFNNYQHQTTPSPFEEEPNFPNPSHHPSTDDKDDDKKLLDQTKNSRVVVRNDLNEEMHQKENRVLNQNPNIGRSANIHVRNNQYIGNYNQFQDTEKNFATNPTFLKIPENKDMSGNKQETNIERPNKDRNENKAKNPVTEAPKLNFLNYRYPDIGQYPVTQASQFKPKFGNYQNPSRNAFAVTEATNRNPRRPNPVTEATMFKANFANNQNPNGNRQMITEASLRIPNAGNYVYPNRNGQWVTEAPKNKPNYRFPNKNMKPVTEASKPKPNLDDRKPPNKNEDRLAGAPNFLPNRNEQRINEASKIEPNLGNGSPPNRNVQRLPDAQKNKPNLSNHPKPTAELLNTKGNEHQVRKNNAAFEINHQHHGRNQFLPTQPKPNLNYQYPMGKFNQVTAPSQHVDFINRQNPTNLRHKFQSEHPEISEAHNGLDFHFPLHFSEDFETVFRLATMTSPMDYESESILFKPPQRNTKAPPANYYPYYKPNLPRTTATHWHPANKSPAQRTMPDRSYYDHRLHVEATTPLPTFVLKGNRYATDQLRMLGEKQSENVESVKSNHEGKVLKDNDFRNNPPEIDRTSDLQSRQFEGAVAPTREDGSDLTSEYVNIINNLNKPENLKEKQIHAPQESVPVNEKIIDNQFATPIFEKSTEPSARINKNFDSNALMFFATTPSYYHQWNRLYGTLDYPNVVTDSSVELKPQIIYHGTPVPDVRQVILEDPNLRSILEKLKLNLEALPDPQETDLGSSEIDGDKGFPSESLKMRKKNNLIKDLLNLSQVYVTPTKSAYYQGVTPAVNKDNLRNSAVTPCPHKARIDNMKSLIGKAVTQIMLQNAIQEIRPLNTAVTQQITVGNNANSVFKQELSSNLLQQQARNLGVQQLSNTMGNLKQNILSHVKQQEMGNSGLIKQNVPSNIRQQVKAGLDVLKQQHQGLMNSNQGLLNFRKPQDKKKCGESTVNEKSINQLDKSITSGNQEQNVQMDLKQDNGFPPHQEGKSTEKSHQEEPPKQDGLIKIPSATRPLPEEKPKTDFGALINSGLILPLNLLNLEPKNPSNSIDKQQVGDIFGNDQRNQATKPPPVITPLQPPGPQQLSGYNPPIAPPVHSEPDVLINTGLGLPLNLLNSGPPKPSDDQKPIGKPTSGLLDRQGPMDITTPHKSSGDIGLINTGLLLPLNVLNSQPLKPSKPPVLQKPVDLTSQVKPKPDLFDQKAPIDVTTPLFEDYGKHENVKGNQISPINGNPNQAGSVLQKQGGLLQSLGLNGAETYDSGPLINTGIVLPINILNSAPENSKPNKPIDVTLPPKTAKQLSENVRNTDVTVPNNSYQQSNVNNFGKVPTRENNGDQKLQPPVNQLRDESLKQPDYGRTSQQSGLLQFQGHQSPDDGGLVNSVLNLPINLLKQISEPNQIDVTLPPKPKQYESNRYISSIDVTHPPGDEENYRENNNQVRKPPTFNEDIRADGIRQDHGGMINNKNTILSESADSGPLIKTGLSLPINLLGIGGQQRTNSAHQQKSIDVTESPSGDINHQHINMDRYIDVTENSRKPMSFYDKKNHKGIHRNIIKSRMSSEEDDELSDAITANESNHPGGAAMRHNLNIPVDIERQRVNKQYNVETVETTLSYHQNIPVDITERQKVPYNRQPNGEQGKTGNRYNQHIMIDNLPFNRPANVLPEETTNGFNQYIPVDITERQKVSNNRQLNPDVNNMLNRQHLALQEGIDVTEQSVYINKNRKIDLLKYQNHRLPYSGIDVTLPSISEDDQSKYQGYDRNFVTDATEQKYGRNYVTSGRYSAYDVTEPYFDQGKFRNEKPSRNQVVVNNLIDVTERVEQLIPPNNIGVYKNLGNQYQNLRETIDVTERTFNRPEIFNGGKQQQQRYPEIADQQDHPYKVKTTESRKNYADAQRDYEGIDVTENSLMNNNAAIGEFETRAKGINLDLLKQLTGNAFNNAHIDITETPKQALQNFNKKFEDTSESFRHITWSMPHPDSNLNYEEHGDDSTSQPLIWNLPQSLSSNHKNDDGEYADVHQQEDDSDNYDLEIIGSNEELDEMFSFHEDDEEKLENSDAFLDQGKRTNMQRLDANFENRKNSEFPINAQKSVVGGHGDQVSEGNLNNAQRLEAHRGSETNIQELQGNPSKSINTHNPQIGEGLQGRVGNHNPNKGENMQDEQNYQTDQGLQGRVVSGNDEKLVTWSMPQHFTNHDFDSGNHGEKITWSIPKFATPPGNIVENHDEVLNRPTEKLSIKQVFQGFTRRPTKTKPESASWKFPSLSRFTKNRVETSTPEPQEASSARFKFPRINKNNEEPETTTEKMKRFTWKSKAEATSERSMFNLFQRTTTPSTTTTDKWRPFAWYTRTTQPPETTPVTRLPLIAQIFRSSTEATTTERPRIWNIFNSFTSTTETSTTKWKPNFFKRANQTSSVTTSSPEKPIWQFLNNLRKPSGAVAEQNAESTAKPEGVTWNLPKEFTNGKNNVKLDENLGSSARPEALTWSIPWEFAIGDTRIPPKQVETQHDLQESETGNIQELHTGNLRIPQHRLPEKPTKSQASFNQNPERPNKHEGVTWNIPQEYMLDNERLPNPQDNQRIPSQHNMGSTIKPEAVTWRMPQEYINERNPTAGNHQNDNLKHPKGNSIQQSTGNDFGRPMPSPAHPSKGQIGNSKPQRSERLPPVEYRNPTTWKPEVQQQYEDATQRPRQHNPARRPPPRNNDINTAYGIPQRTEFFGNEIHRPALAPQNRPQQPNHRFSPEPVRSQLTPPVHRQNQIAGGYHPRAQEPAVNPYGYQTVGGNRHSQNAIPRQQHNIARQQEPNHQQDMRRKQHPPIHTGRQQQPRNLVHPQQGRKPAEYQERRYNQMHQERMNPPLRAQSEFRSLDANEPENSIEPTPDTFREIQTEDVSETTPSVQEIMSLIKEMAKARRHETTTPSTLNALRYTEELVFRPSGSGFEFFVATGAPYIPPTTEKEEHLDEDMTKYLASLLKTLSKSAGAEEEPLQDLIDKQLKNDTTVRHVHSTRSIHGGETQTQPVTPNKSLTDEEKIQKYYANTLKPRGNQMVRKVTISKPIPFDESVPPHPGLDTMEMLSPFFYLVSIAKQKNGTHGALEDAKNVQDESGETENVNEEVTKQELHAEDNNIVNKVTSGGLQHKRLHSNLKDVRMADKSQVMRNQQRYNMYPNARHNQQFSSNVEDRMMPNQLPGAHNQQQYHRPNMAGRKIPNKSTMMHNQQRHQLRSNAEVRNMSFGTNRQLLTNSILEERKMGSKPEPTAHVDVTDTLMHNTSPRDSLNTEDEIDDTQGMLTEVETTTEHHLSQGEANTFSNQPELIEDPQTNAENVEDRILTNSELAKSPSAGKKLISIKQALDQIRKEDSNQSKNHQLVVKEEEQVNPSNQDHSFLGNHLNERESIGTEYITPANLEGDFVVKKLSEYTKSFLETTTESVDIIRSRTANYGKKSPTGTAESAQESDDVKELFASHGPPSDKTGETIVQHPMEATEVTTETSDGILLQTTTSDKMLHVDGNNPKSEGIPIETSSKIIKIVDPTTADIDDIGADEETHKSVKEEKKIKPSSSSESSELSIEDPLKHLLKQYSKYLRHYKKHPRRKYSSEEEFYLDGDSLEDYRRRLKERKWRSRFRPNSSEDEDEISKIVKAAERKLRMKYYGRKQYIPGETLEDYNNRQLKLMMQARQYGDFLKNEKQPYFRKRYEHLLIPDSTYEDLIDVENVKLRKPEDYKYQLLRNHLEDDDLLDERQRVLKKYLQKEEFGLSDEIVPRMERPVESFTNLRVSPEEYKMMSKMNSINSGKISPENYENIRKFNGLRHPDTRIEEYHNIPISPAQRVPLGEDRVKDLERNAIVNNEISRIDDANSIIYHSSNPKKNDNMARSNSAATETKQELRRKGISKGVRGNREEYLSKPSINFEDDDETKNLSDTIYINGRPEIKVSGIKSPKQEQPETVASKQPVKSQPEGLTLQVDRVNPTEDMSNSIEEMDKFIKSNTETETMQTSEPITEKTWIKLKKITTIPTSIEETESENSSSSEIATIRRHKQRVATTEAIGISSSEESRSAVNSRAAAKKTIVTPMQQSDSESVETVSVKRRPNRITQRVTTETSQHVSDEESESESEENFNSLEITTAYSITAKARRNDVKISTETPESESSGEEYSDSTEEFKNPNVMKGNIIADTTPTPDGRLFADTSKKYFDLLKHQTKDIQQSKKSVDSRDKQESIKENMEDTNEEVVNVRLHKGRHKHKPETASEDVTASEEGGVEIEEELVSQKRRSKSKSKQKLESKDDDVIGVDTKEEIPRSKSKSNSRIKSVEVTRPVDAIGGGGDNEEEIPRRKSKSKSKSKVKEETTKSVEVTLRAAATGDGGVDTEEEIPPRRSRSKSKSKVKEETIRSVEVAGDADTAGVAGVETRQDTPRHRSRSKSKSTIKEEINNSIEATGGGGIVSNEAITRRSKSKSKHREKSVDAVETGNESEEKKPRHRSRSKPKIQEEPVDSNEMTGGGGMGIGEEIITRKPHRKRIKSKPKEESVAESEENTKPHRRRSKSSRIPNDSESENALGGRVAWKSEEVVRETRHRSRSKPKSEPREENSNEYALGGVIGGGGAARWDSEENSRTHKSKSKSRSHKQTESHEVHRRPKHYRQPEVEEEEEEDKIPEVGGMIQIHHKRKKNKKTEDSEPEESHGEVKKNRKHRHKTDEHENGDEGFNNERYEHHDDSDRRGRGGKHRSDESSERRQRGKHRKEGSHGTRRS